VCVFAPIFKVPLALKMKTSLELPEIVVFELTPTGLSQWYKPGYNVNPPIAPAPTAA